MTYEKLVDIFVDKMVDPYTCPINEFSWWPTTNVCIDIWCERDESIADDRPELWDVKAKVTNIKTHNEWSDSIKYENLIWFGLRAWTDILINVAQRFELEEW